VVSIGYLKITEDRASETNFADAEVALTSEVGLMPNARVTFQPKRGR